MRLKRFPYISYQGIRLRLTLIFLLCFGVMSSLGMLLLHNSLTPTFSELEQDSASRNITRVAESLSAELASLALLTRDWATWDDMYQFASQPGQAFRDSNLDPSTLQHTELGLILIFDQQAQLVGAASALASDGNQPLMPSPTLLFQQVVAPQATPFCGFLPVDRTLLLLCAETIRPSDGQGPAGGTLIMARDLGSARLQALQQRTQLPFELQFPMAEMRAAAEEQWTFTPPGYLQDSRIDVTRQADRLILNYSLTDLLGQASARLHLEMPRTLVEQGRRLLWQTSLQLGLIAVATGILLLGALQWLFIHPLAQLQHTVSVIYGKKAWKKRMQVSRKDEIGRLGREINGLLEVIQAQVENLEALSLTDPLTGLANRRALDLRLGLELQRAHRTGTAFSVLLIDIDFFKQYNDFYGHAAGDRALQQLAEVMSRVVQRGQDLIARLGGEEFLALLPNTDADSAQQVAQVLLAELERRAIPHQRSPVSNWLTLSIGLASCSGGEDSAEAVLERADQALYAAKQQGRNRTVTAESIAEAE